LRKRLPPLNPLRAFEATARHGSLTKAAEELSVTHGAVSHQIKALEQSLGVKLFERAGQRLKPTPHGAELLPAVSSAFDGIAAAALKLTRPASSGTLSLSCVPALLSLWLIPRLGTFVAQYPDIQLNLTGSNDPQNIRSAEFDLCLLYGDGRWNDCWMRRWSGLELFPVVSPTLVNARPLRSVRDLGNHVLLHGDHGREWHTWLAAADALDLERGRRHHFTDAHLSIGAALHGHGVALGDTVTASGLLARGQLVAPFGLAVPAVDDFYVVCRNEMKSAPIVRVFIDWLFAEKMEADGRGDPLAGGRIGMRRRGAATR
jgi:LysR family glycine cleavage system transcriptional activator